LRFLALFFFLFKILTTPSLKTLFSLSKYLSQILSLNVYSLFNLLCTLLTLDFMELLLKKKHKKKTKEEWRKLWFTIIDGFL
jgi:hypothetical protein